MTEDAAGDPTDDRSETAVDDANDDATGQANDDATDGAGGTIEWVVERCPTRGWRVLFGDRLGLLVWLGLLLSFSVLWRVGFFLTDTYTVANTLANLADGHLAVRNVEYSLTGVQPGLGQYDGLLYGRNYGQAFLALPLLWLLEGASAVVEPRFVLLGGWALGGLAFARGLGTVVEGRPWADVSGGLVAVAGSVVAICVVLVGVVIGTPLDPGRLPLVALQLGTLLAAATVGLLVYRLVDEFEGQRVGLVAGVAAGLATPIGFWASMPKRHVLVAMFVLAAVYCFTRSRRTGSLRYRAGAYVFAGLVAWIHAFEGFFLVAALAPIDLATARENGWRELGVLALALSLALAPTLATNVAISDNPLQSPRLLPWVGGSAVELAPDGQLQSDQTSSGIRTGGGGDELMDDDASDPAADTTDGSDAGTGDGSSGGPLAWVFGLVAGIGGALIGLLPNPPDSVLVILGFVLSTITDGVAALVDPERLWNVFVRSGSLPGGSDAGTHFETIDLTMLESMPLLGALAALPVLAVTKLRRGGRSLLGWPRSLEPARQTDLLVVSVVATLTVIYLSRLPIQSQLTVRYLLPIYPLGVYAVARIGAVSVAVTTARRALVAAYAGTLVGGTVLVVALSVLIEPALGEAVQLHALANLAAATLLALVVLGRSMWPDRVGSRHLAVALGVTAGMTTVYVALAGLAYFPYGTYAFDGARQLAESLSTLV